MRSRLATRWVVVLMFLTTLGVAETASAQLFRRFRLRPSRIPMGQMGPAAPVGPVVPSDASFKSLLAKVPQPARLRFLESMVFADGVLATVRIDEVKSSLGTSQYKALMRSVSCVAGCSDHTGYRCFNEGGDLGWVCKKGAGYICNTKLCNNKNGNAVWATFTADSPLFDGVTAAERTKFLTSLDFANGRLTSAHVGDLQRGLKTSNFDRVFKALGAKPAEVKTKATAGLYRTPTIRVTRR